MRQPHKWRDQAFLSRGSSFGDSCVCLFQSPSGARIWPLQPHQTVTLSPPSSTAVPVGIQAPNSEFRKRNPELSSRVTSPARKVGCSLLNVAHREHSLGGASCDGIPRVDYLRPLPQGVFLWAQFGFCFCGLVWGCPTCSRRFTFHHLCDSAFSSSSNPLNRASSRDDRRRDPQENNPHPPSTSSKAQALGGHSSCLFLSLLCRVSCEVTLNPIPL